MTRICEVCNGTGRVRRSIIFWRLCRCWNCAGTGREFDIVGTLLERRFEHVERVLAIKAKICNGSRISRNPEDAA